MLIHEGITINDGLPWNIRPAKKTNGRTTLTEPATNDILSRLARIKSADVIERYGFYDFLAMVREVRQGVSDDVWLEVGWKILEGLGLEEFYGCDYDILATLEHIPPESALVDVQTFLRHTLVETLFEPIGIDGFDWWQVPASGQYGVSGGLYLTPRDMARLGYLFLNNGTWNGTQVISSDWVRRSTMSYYDTGWYGYGYLWWNIPDTSIYEATGHYEQKIYVIPEQDIVVVITGDVQDADYHPTDYFVLTYVLPSLTRGSANYASVFILSVSIVILAIPAVVAFQNYRRLCHIKKKEYHG
jgi:hypothetical protein